MSKKMRFLSFFLALAMVISSAPIVPVYAQEEASVSGLTVPFRSDVPFTVNGTTVTSNSYRIPAMVTLSAVWIPWLPNLPTAARPGVTP